MQTSIHMVGFGRFKISLCDDLGRVPKFGKVQIAINYKDIIDFRIMTYKRGFLTVIWILMCYLLNLNLTRHMSYSVFPFF